MGGENTEAHQRPPSLLLLLLLSLLSSSLLAPPSSLLVPPSSLLVPRSSFLVPPSSLLVPHSSVPAFVTTAAQSAARDAAAIAAGTPSALLMSRAGTAAAGALRRHAGGQLQRGVAVFAGTGNNGGDAWVVARLLRQGGATVRVHATGQPGTADAVEARNLALADGAFDEPRGDEAVAVDGLLGTGATGAPRGAVADALASLGALAARGAFVLALDVPSGLDASTGDVADATVPADLTVTFGTLKRGLVIARAVAGAIEVADIGLGAHALPR